jgi:predicted dehydrogenase
MAAAKIGVGIIGATPGQSWAAVAHVPALRLLPGYEIVAVANSNAASAEAAAGTLSIPTAHADAAALAQDPAVDLVAVTVKVPHHNALVDAALDAGKMVYCEWPLGNGLAEAEAMAARAASLGVRTAVGLQARSSPTIRYLRDLIRDGYIGEVLSATLVGSSISHGPVAPANLKYLYDRKNGAGALAIPFGHTIDALCFCLGEFTEVSATLATRRKTFTVAETGEVLPSTIDDQIAVSGLLEGGIVVSAHYRSGASRGTNLLWEINGTKGDLQITSDSGHGQLADLVLMGGQSADTALAVMEVPAEYRTVSAETPSYAVNVGEAYARFALGPDAPDPVPDFDHAVVRHRLLDAIERSAANGERIKL